MAPFADVIPTLVDELGLTLHYPNPLDDLAAAGAALAARVTAGPRPARGVIEDVRMRGWTPEQTRAEVRRLCEAGKPGDRFLLGTGVMPMAVLEANRDAGLEHLERVLAAALAGRDARERP